MYAQLCKRIQKELETDIDKSKSSTFLQILLNVCRDKFENRVKYSEQFINSESPLTDDLEEKKNVAKQKILGNVKFIGELYKLGMLGEPHLYEMLRSLFTNKSNSSTEKNCEDMECLAQLIRTCGKNLDTELGKQLMDQYFERIERYSQSQSMFPPRIRFLLRDLIELRNNNWTPRKVALVEGPTPIQELSLDDDVLPPGLNHLRNRDRDYRNNDRSEQRDWIGKFSFNLHNLNDGFNLLSVSSPSPLLPSSYNQSSNGYGNRDHRDNGGGGGGGGNLRMHNNRNNQGIYGNNNMRYNKHNNHHHQGSGGGGGYMRGDGGNGSHQSPYGGNSNMMINKDLAPRFKRNLMTPPQNPVEELQMRPTPNSLLFKANMNIKPQLPITTTIGGGSGGPGTGGGTVKGNFNGPPLNEFPSPLTTRTLLSEQRNAGQINSSAFSGGNSNSSSMMSGGANFGGSGSSPASASSSTVPRGGAMQTDGMMGTGRNSGGPQQSSNQTSSPNVMNHRHHQQQHMSPGMNSRPMGANDGGNMHLNKHHSDMNQHHHHHHYQNQQGSHGQVAEHHPHHHHQHQHGRDMNGGDSRMNSNHHEPSSHRPHSSEQQGAGGLSNTAAGVGTGNSSSLLNGSKMVQKDQISKQASADKADKKKKEKGLSKEDHLKRIATFVSDVMLDNIKQQIEEDEQKKASEVGAEHDETNNDDGNVETSCSTPVKEVVVEVVDNSEVKATETPPPTPADPSEVPVKKASLIENAELIEQKLKEQDDVAEKEKKVEQQDGNGTVDEKLDIGSETQKDENDDSRPPVLVENQQQQPQQQDEPTTATASDEVTASDEAKEQEEMKGDDDAAVVGVSTTPESTELLSGERQTAKKSSLMEQLVNAFCELKVPEKFMREAMITILNHVLDRTDAYHAKTIEFLQLLHKETKLSHSAALESFKSIVNGMNEKEKTVPKITTIVASLLARGVAGSLCQLSDVANFTENGQHYPLFLLVLQHLHKQIGKQPLQELFNKSKVNLMDSLPECDRTKDRMAEILEDRNLNFLYPLLRVQAELWKQILSDANPQQFYKWIKENVEPSCYAEQGFIVAIMTVLLKYIHQESENLKEDKKRIEKEKEILTKYCPVLNAFLNGNIDLQLTAVYAIQVFWYNIGYPKGVLLRWFQEMYELSVIEEDAFLRYKEDVTDIYPGKGKALFQVNQWLTWLAEAEDEDDDEED
ncbi:eukaryotic translation initiation factor 4 gamma 2 [Anopheles stephensi]|uniref:eukaryotic translation initiation factor 4 gamma 2 n=1 Tax=Anopheles stephensi TaxID=30069 RepID=UPI00165875E0|nr:eukaryotic translation initiation factor 4 gamma 2 [Anopheles stephensi]XP_035912592.1 eukaryotic translation initiation factor 4 gamma 2 [Anopheles stephensi]XP_035912593.1 eukaryotic translation initiation factor 4 gamma 2 [Anopheles stephensi]XP_035912594.1 eukaryotic translation initiation factor 4 gamma 2 [Anopheles stephensi]XP_035912595.1 eukaryotic translation initiation factor 4 gamma 2 [Anopheles stephensi]XP_035912596.1 eukaryotic translation initiation factor 4 gamma 2 [Anophele